MTLALTEHLLGFGARYAPELMLAWGPKHRAQYLLRQDIEAVLTTDCMQWLSVFDQPVLVSGGPNGESYFFPEPRIALPQWIGANPDLWENLADLRAHLALHCGAIREPHWLIAITWHQDSAGPDRRDVGPHELPTVPPSRDASWKLLGYDVSDGSLLSGLTNCGYSPEESSSLTSAWTGDLNQYHLFNDIDRAYQFVQLTDPRVPEHAPFFVYGLLAH